MNATCCNCFAGRIIKSVCDNCGHDYHRRQGDHAAPRRPKLNRERLPNHHEQRILRKAVYQSTGADVFNSSI